MLLVCIDVGKPGTNLGWAAFDGARWSDGNDLDDCIELIAGELKIGPVSLGFECPLFIPVRDDPLLMTKARNGESGPGLAPRAFSAGAGPAVSILGLMTACYVLRHLIALVPEAQATLDWRQPLTGHGRLLIWEAFVTAQRKVHDARHVEDAKLALEAYQSRAADPTHLASSVVEPSCVNLLGTALLRTGWTTNIGVLAEQCLVIRV
jgi:hypothetical protein